MMVPGKRVYLGRMLGFLMRQRVYSISNGLEIDDLDIFNILRRRVFFDDVLMITRHRFYGKAFIAMMATCAIFFFVIAAVAMLGSPESAVVFGLMGIAFLAPLAIRLFYGVDAITIYGRRTKARIDFHIQKAKCDEVYKQLCELTRLRQEAVANEILAEESEHATHQTAVTAPPPSPPLSTELPQGGVLPEATENP
jgi:hypothetical protein